MGIVKGICISKERGTAKTQLQEAEFLVNWGIEKDAHGGKWHRQVSLLSWEKIQQFCKNGQQIAFGAFGENLIVEGIDFKNLPLGSRFRCGEVLLEMTQVGKECHNHCHIYQQMGDCIMPREGVFAVVLEGGKVKVGDNMEVIPPDLYRTLADRDPSLDCTLARVVGGSHQGEQTLWINGVTRWNSSEFLKTKEKQLLALSTSQMLELEDQKIFCEKVGSPKSLVICGAGHVSIPIIRLGKALGFSVTVIDDRPLFANHARRAQADQVICSDFSQGLKQIPGSPDTYFVIVTRGHRYDTDCLRLAMEKKNAYIGMMGSKKRVAMVKKQLEEEGISKSLLDQIHSPIGLSIGAETPEEIAVSIMAEIIQEKNRKKNISGYDKKLLACLVNQEEKVLCTIVSRKGSAPREIGTKMAIQKDGSSVGTIGGGCAESRILHMGLEMLRTGSPKTRLELVDMTGQEAEDLGMVCGGRILVYMELLQP